MAVTTKFWTLQQIIDKVEMDLDLEDEDFVQAAEMIGYVEEAVDEAEKMVHTLYEDYFLTKAPITLVSGTDTYALPVDIFAQKLRTLVYTNGTRTYTVKRIRDWRKFQEYSEARIASPNSSEELKYFLLNSAPGGAQIVFTGVPQESGALITAWYLRQANRLEVPADTLDIPEASTYVVQFVKVRCLEKEVGHPSLPDATAKLDFLRQNLESTLTDMVPDNENEIEMDLCIYEEMN